MKNKIIIFFIFSNFSLFPREEMKYNSNNRKTVILIASNSAVHVNFAWSAALLLIRINVLEKANLEEKVSKHMDILELVAASPPPTLLI